MEQIVKAQYSLDNNEYLLQFLPKKLNDILSNKQIEFKSKNLKAEYLIDIVHNLILKYYFRRINEFSLSSTILKEKYGRIYNYYIDFLVQNGVIVLKKNYSVGNSSRIYSLSEKIINDKIDRYHNTNKNLITKKNKKTDINNKNKINIGIKLKLIESLKLCQIDFDKSIFYLNSIITEKNSLEKNLYAVESIQKRYLFWHFDDYGRFHSNFTILKSFIRKNYLTIDKKETAEIDIPNSQPLFLMKLIRETQSKYRHSEMEVFSQLVKNGKLYDFLKENTPKSNREEIKKMVYQVLFGINNRSKSDNLFRKQFPSIYSFICEYKRTMGNYKSLSHTLQSMESDFVYNRVIYQIVKLIPDINLTTVHDSIIIPSEFKNLCNEVLHSELNNLYY